MGSTNRLIRLPNAEAWVEKDSVVAVARQQDSTMKDANGEGVLIVMINFSIRLTDGKAINLSSPDRVAVQQFLDSIGVSWSA